MTTLFFALFIVLILAELIKGLSANGTPPLLQKFAWQLDLAYFMWSNIALIRIVLAMVLIAVAYSAPVVTVLISAILCGAIWAGIYWVFNHFWVGRVKFLPITQKIFLGKDENQIELDMQVIGISLNGEEKAFPVAMLFYHHQISSSVGGHPVWATYCGLCRSGRIYDATVAGKALDFSLIGAITFNAVFKDNQTGTWWRQETGEAAKGPLAGEYLADFPSEQMTLKNWLEKYPQSTVLQYDPAFQKKYNFLTKLLNYEASLPGWHRQETPPLIIGVEIKEHARAYDWAEVQKRRLVHDTLGETPILVLSDAAGASGFVYERQVGGKILHFDVTEDRLNDRETGSEWDVFGRCHAGELKGKSLTHIQSYQQFLRAWISFHGHTTFYEF